LRRDSRDSSGNLVLYRHQVCKSQLYAANQHAERNTRRLVDAEDIALAESQNIFKIQSEAPQLQLDQQRHTVEAREVDVNITHLFSG